jgi:hypothetical protein
MHLPCSLNPVTSKCRRRLWLAGGASQVALRDISLYDNGDSGTLAHAKNRLSL